VAGFDRQVAVLDAKLKQVGQQVRTSFIPIVEREMTAAFDKSAAATLRFDKAEASLQARFQAG
jgi:hypothetical protein